VGIAPLIRKNSFCHPTLPRRSRRSRRRAFTHVPTL
jgi:hypothetical protein